MNFENLFALFNDKSVTHINKVVIKLVSQSVDHSDSQSDSQSASESENNQSLNKLPGKSKIKLLSIKYYL